MSRMMCQWHSNNKHVMMEGHGEDGSVVLSVGSRVGSDDSQGQARTSNAMTR